MAESLRHENEDLGALAQWFRGKVPEPKTPWKAQRAESNTIGVSHQQIVFSIEGEVPILSPFYSVFLRKFQP